jgi:hypothetical protein
MTMNGSAFHALAAALRAVLATLIGAVLGLAGLVLMLFALVIGTATAAALIAWALLRGRRPQGIRFGMPPGARFGASPPWQRKARGEVVDVEVRDVTPRGPGAR